MKTNCEGRPANDFCKSLTRPEYSKKIGLKTKFIAQIKKGIACLLAAVIISAVPASLYSAEANVPANMTSDAYTFFSEALQASFASGTVRISGFEEVTAALVNKQYHIDGHIDTTDTVIRFTHISKNSIPVPEQTGFRIFGSKLFVNSEKNLEWQEQSISNVLAKMTSMGTLDMFFALELLSGGHAELYKPYIAFGEDAVRGETVYRTITVSLTNAQYTSLFNEWTSDMRAVLGSAADGMSDRELAMLRTLVRIVLAGLEAEGCFTFFIEPETLRIARIETLLLTADPDARSLRNSETQKQPRRSEGILKLIFENS